jgi:hypothetical protein
VGHLEVGPAAAAAAAVFTPAAVAAAADWLVATGVPIAGSPSTTPVAAPGAAKSPAVAPVAGTRGTAACCCCCGTMLGYGLLLYMLLLLYALAGCGGYMGVRLLLPGRGRANGPCVAAPNMPPCC